MTDANNGAFSLMEASRATLRSMMVLLVDDQPVIAEAVRRMLMSEPDIHFHYCGNPFEAVELARKLKPTVILQDLVMPEMDGLTLLRQYRATDAVRDTPIIVLSTKEEAEVKSASFTAGADDYLVKLPDSIELIARIRHHSKSHTHQVQRDEAYRALYQSQKKLLETNIELQRLATLDALTGVSNRRYFVEFVDLQWKLAIREQAALSMLMIDVDDFKGYNDKYGHLAGDDALKRIASTMKQVFKRPTDLCGRFGGEEFVVLLPDTGPPATPLLAERLRAAIAELHIPHEVSVIAPYLSVSVGCVYTLPKEGSSPALFVQAADASLYQAKRAGKNQSSACAEWKA